MGSYDYRCRNFSFLGGLYLPFESPWTDLYVYKFGFYSKPPMWRKPGRGEALGLLSCGTLEHPKAGFEAILD